MSIFANIQSLFDTNWNTLLIGWNGLGTFSPWPDQRDTFPPLLCFAEISSYGTTRLSSASDITEIDLILKLLEGSDANSTREEIRNILSALANLNKSDPLIELRKWRVVLLMDLIYNLPTEATLGLAALSEFWQSFGFPPDSPHDIQGRNNHLTPQEYYRESHLRQKLAQHEEWIKRELLVIQNQDR